MKVMTLASSATTLMETRTRPAGQVSAMETPGRRSPGAAASAEPNPLPERASTRMEGLLSSWPGRILVRTAASFARIEVFDRSMTVAAQFFTSVFPLLILFATWAGKGDSGTISDSVSMPEESRSVLQDAVEAAGVPASGSSAPSSC